MNDQFKWKCILIIVYGNAHSLIGYLLLHTAQHRAGRPAVHLLHADARLCGRHSGSAVETEADLSVHRLATHPHRLPDQLQRDLRNAA